MRLEMSALPVSSQVPCLPGAGVCLSGQSRLGQSKQGDTEGLSDHHTWWGQCPVIGVPLCLPSWGLLTSALWETLLCQETDPEKLFPRELGSRASPRVSDPS